MPVDPHLAGLLQMMESAAAPPMSEGTPAEARAAFRTLSVDARPGAPGGAGGERRGGRRPGSRRRPRRPGLPPRGERAAAHRGPLPRRRLGGRRPRHPRQRRAQHLPRRAGRSWSRSTTGSRPRRRSPPPWTTPSPRRRGSREHLADLGGDRPARGRRRQRGRQPRRGRRAAARDTGGPAIAAQLLVYPAVDVLGRVPLPHRERHRLLPRPAHDGLVHGPLRRRGTTASTTRGCPRCAPRTSAGSRPRSWSPRSSTRCATRARRTPSGCARRASGRRTAVRRDDPRVLRHGAVLPGAQKAVDETCERFAELLRG